MTNYVETNFTLPQALVAAVDELLSSTSACFDVSAGQQDDHRVINLYLPADEADELNAALQQFGVKANFQPLVEQDWVQQTQASFEPLTLVPFWIHSFAEQADECPSGLTSLQIPHAMAFGTGEHATTELCLAYLAKILPNSAIKTGLDQGTGTGILSIAAAKLEPNLKLTAIDIDPTATELAQQNVMANHVSEQIELHTASEPVASQYDLIMANILANPLIEFSPKFAACANKGAQVILSGYLTEQAEAISAAYEQAGFSKLDEQVRDNWCASHWQLQ